VVGAAEKKNRKDEGSVETTQKWLRAFELKERQKEE